MANVHPVPPTKVQPAGRFTKSDAMPTSFQRTLAGCWPRIQRWRLVRATYTRTGARPKAHLEFAFKFFPKGYKPLYRRSTMSLGNSMDIDARPNQPNQELHAYAVLQEPTKIITFEPHMHASGVRMCMEAIWGDHIQMLNCVGYDHNW